MPHPPRPGDGHLLGLLRIVTGSLFACHGVAKLFGVIGDGPVPTGLWPYWWAGLIGLTGGALLIRPAAPLCSGVMAYAYFTEHQPDRLLPMQNDGELAVLYCWTFLALAVAAPTALSLRGARRHLAAALRPTKPRPAGT
ncbi:hypothetical protein GCM10010371_67980 [Streptomyces subrutilus]|uniref:DoxX family protein n=1 Tax=Streptomyces subrutilus TaxID=36818 RepID=A0A918VGA1_9ACTN|nr:DoxX family protein [Streptomyces subrutilus]GGZ98781.1 hypothetical protein GCM10010371_67980 [Streptomyces subrutilus]